MDIQLLQINESKQHDSNKHMRYVLSSIFQNAASMGCYSITS